MIEFTSLDDEELVEYARADPAAFEILYTRYQAAVYRYLFQRLGTTPDAEDVTSRVFVDVLEGLVAQRYRERHCFAAWLFTIVRRRLIDFYRQRTPKDLEASPPIDPDILGELENGENLARLTRLLDQLEEDKRELLRLRFAAGLSYAAIAALDGRSEPAVKMAVYRLLVWLRDHWEDTHA